MVNMDTMIHMGLIVLRMTHSERSDLCWVNHDTKTNLGVKDHYENTNPGLYRLMCNQRSKNYINSNVYRVNWGSKSRDTGLMRIARSRDQIGHRDSRDPMMFRFHLWCHPNPSYVIVTSLLHHLTSILRHSDPKDRTDSIPQILQGGALLLYNYFRAIGTLFDRSDFFYFVVGTVRAA